MWCIAYLDFLEKLGGIVARKLKRPTPGIHGLEILRGLHVGVKRCLLRMSGGFLRFWIESVDGPLDAVKLAWG